MLGSARPFAAWAGLNRITPPEKFARTENKPGDAGVVPVAKSEVAALAPVLSVSTPVAAGSGSGLSPPLAACTGCGVAANQAAHTAAAASLLELEDAAAGFLAGIGAATAWPGSSNSNALGAASAETDRSVAPRLADDAAGDGDSGGRTEVESCMDVDSFRGAERIRPWMRHEVANCRRPACWISSIEVFQRGLRRGGRAGHRRRRNGSSPRKSARPRRAS